MGPKDAGRGGHARGGSSRARAASGVRDESRRVERERCPREHKYATPRSSVDVRRARAMRSIVEV